jgi:hypothetical protein
MSSAKSTLPFLMGRFIVSIFFASRLKYSRFICVRVVNDQAVESLVRNLAEHLDRRGVMCVFESAEDSGLKVAEKRRRHRTESGHCPQQKGAVKKLAGFGKSQQSIAVRVLLTGFYTPGLQRSSFRAVVQR